MIGRVPYSPTLSEDWHSSGLIGLYLMWKKKKRKLTKAEAKIFHKALQEKLKDKSERPVQTINIIFNSEICEEKND